MTQYEPLPLWICKLYTTFHEDRQKGEKKDNSQWCKIQTNSISQYRVLERRWGIQHCTEGRRLWLWSCHAVSRPPSVAGTLGAPTSSSRDSDMGAPTLPSGHLRLWQSTPNNSCTETETHVVTISPDLLSLSFKITPCAFEVTQLFKKKFKGVTVTM